MRSVRTSLVLVLCLSCVTGCGDSRGGGGTPVRAFYGDLARALGVACDCYEALGHPSRAECLALVPAPDADLLDCLDDAYEANEAGAREPVACVARAANDLERCLGGVSACDAAMLQACNEAYSAAASGCPPLSSAAQADFDACVTVPPPTGSSYGECVDSADCRSPDTCFDVEVADAGTFGQLCSRTCSADAQCSAARGFAAACYGIGGDTTLVCYQRCDLDSDCASGSVCIEVVLTTGGVDFICVPDN